jgi:hypothetical protein
VIGKSRLFMALGLALALGTSSVAFADTPEGVASAERTDATAAQNEFGPAVAHVMGQVTPKRLPPRRYRNVKFFVEVNHDNADPEDTSVPKPTRRVEIDFGRNVRFRLGARAKCFVNLEGTTTQEARDLCPARSLLGAGRAFVRLRGPGGEGLNFTDLQVSVFNGSDLPGRNLLRLHAYSPTLGGANSQVIQGKVRPAPGARWGQRLIADVPPIAGGTGSNTRFGATIRRNTGTVQARCRARFFFWRTRYTFRDGSTARATHRQRCRRR